MAEEQNLNLVEGLGVLMPDHMVHACKDVEHTKCGLPIPDEARMRSRRKIVCPRCQDAMDAEAH